jgi:hypothetical protein
LLLDRARDVEYSQGVALAFRVIFRLVCLLLLGTMSLLLVAFDAAGQPAQTKPPFAVTHGSEIAAAINIPQKDLKLEGALFLPENARRIRAVLVVMANAETIALMLTGQNAYSVWHTAAESLSCALLHLRVSTIRAPEPGRNPNDPQRNAALGGADGLLALMHRFARESRHPELVNAPFVFWGWSAQSAFGPTFALLHPERTVGFIRYHSGGFPIEVGRLKGIPALLFLAAQDNPDALKAATTSFDQARSLSAPWAMVVQSGAHHEIRAPEIESAARLTMPWIDAVVNARVRGTQRLQPLTSTDGWLGDHRTGAISRATEAESSQAQRSWLPDERTATAWQSFVAAPK